MNRRNDQLIIQTESGSYPVNIARGGLKTAGDFFDLSRKVLIVTDRGVPGEYIDILRARCKTAFEIVLPQGEQNKSIENLCKIFEILAENGFSRSDCILAVGGGMVGDIAGFAAACYLRGIDFYNIPTTLLSQVDSSIGGKTAVDFYGFKNMVGVFYQPRAVLIDADILKTLPKRLLSEGMAEVIKMSLTCDRELFEFVENAAEIYTEGFLDYVILKSLKIKKSIVEEDEKENRKRKVLNFGHTIGHAVESCLELSSKAGFLHGECVAIGMIPMCSDETVKRLMPVLKKYGLDKKADIPKEKLKEAIRHDKKVSGDKITAIYVNEIGTYEMKDILLTEFEKTIDRVWS